MPESTLDQVLEAITEAQQNDTLHALGDAE